MKRVALVAVALQVLLCVVVLVRLPAQVAGQIAEDPQFNVSKIESFFNSSGRLPSTQPHTNNWAVLVRLSFLSPALLSLYQLNHNKNLTQLLVHRWRRPSFGTTTDTWPTC